MKFKGKTAVIAGAGIGGLATACRLAQDGFAVTVIEKNETVGGKCNEFNLNGYRFDTGPSVVTMKFVLEELFESCGKSIDGYLKLRPVEPTCRYFFTDDEHPLDIFSNRPVDGLSGDDSEAFSGFLKYSETLWDKTAGAFVFNPLARIQDLAGLRLTDALTIGAFKTLANEVDWRIKNEKLRLILKRFATYNGSDPWKTPATLNVIPHVELNLGAFYPAGGLYQIPLALKQLATELGVNFRFGEKVERVVTKDGLAKEIHSSGGSYPCDVFVSNTDAAWFYGHLFPKKGISGRIANGYTRLEPSCSGFVILAGVSKKFEALQHHNIFFSKNYREEFVDLFDRKVPAKNPTVYVANTSLADPDHAPDGCSNLFILVNAPYTSTHHTWTDAFVKSYASSIFERLSDAGISIKESDIEVIHTITPQDFSDLYLTNRGSIYGFSSNSVFSAFLRPRNRVPGLQNVFLTGGSSHPGGGIPLVLTSAAHVQQLVHQTIKPE